MVPDEILALEMIISLLLLQRMTIRLQYPS